VNSKKQISTLRMIFVGFSIAFISAIIAMFRKLLPAQYDIFTSIALGFAIGTLFAELRHIIILAKTIKKLDKE